MASGEDVSILKRKAAAGREKGPAGRRPGTSKALAMAISRATEAQLELPSFVGESAEHICSLAEVLERLPDGGLFALLDGPQEAQGLMVLDPLFLASLIEKQMTGKLADDAPAPRRATRTDAALSADLIDAILGLFAAEFEGRPEWRWVSGYGYASYLEEPRPLALILEDTDYRLFTFTAELAAGRAKDRQVSGMIAYLAEGRGPIVPDPDAMDDTPPDVTPAAWKTALETSVAKGEVTLNGVLHRFKRSIGEVADLEPGQIIPLPLHAIDNTQMTALDGSLVAVGRLGASGGMRAVRLVTGEGTSQAVSDSHRPGQLAAGQDTLDLMAEVASPDASEAMGELAQIEPPDLEGLETLSEPQGLPDMDMSDLVPMADLPDLT